MGGMGTLIPLGQHIGQPCEDNLTLDWTQVRQVSSKCFNQIIVFSLTGCFATLWREPITSTSQWWMISAATGRAGQRLTQP